MQKKKVLVITGRYLPGYKDGGPVRSLINLTEWMGDEYDFRIMCLDRDHGDTECYPDIKVREYNRVGKAQVWYTPSFTDAEIEKLSKDADTVYVCGPYNDYARMAMRLKKTGQIAAPLYVASMGSFSPEAFRIKGFKKKLFISCMKFMHMFDRISWSVTSKREEEELAAVIGKDARCVIASDLPRKELSEHSHVKSSGELKVIFLSRISRKKNLAIIPDIFRMIDDTVKIKLDIYGYPEDKDYLHECMGRFDELRRTHPDCRWEYKGVADSGKVPQIFSEYDVFLFPTLGENYGHVIAESMSAGCIPVISDTTCWLDLDDRGCGYVCSLNDLSSFARPIEALAAMTEEELSHKRARCYEYMKEVNKASAQDSGYRRIFG